MRGLVLDFSQSEVSALALLLASDDARFICGADHQLDGGISGRLHDPV